MIKKEGMGRRQESFPRGGRGEDKCGRQRRAGEGSQPRRRSPSDSKSLFARRDEIKNKPEQSALHERPRLPMLS